MISGRCVFCERKWRAPEELAGRSLRCRGCGSVFVVEGATPDIGFVDDKEDPPSIAPVAPAGKAELDETPVGGMPAIGAATNPTAAANRPTSAAGSAAVRPVTPPPPPRPAGKVEPVKKPSPADVMREAVAKGSTKGDALGGGGWAENRSITPGGSAYRVEGDRERPGPWGGREPTGWYRYPAAVTTDRWAVPGILLGGTVWAMASIYGAGDGAPLWTAATRILVVALLYVGVVSPLTRWGISAGQRSLGKSLPREATRRGLAAYLPAALLGIVLWNAGGGATPALIGGTILGLGISVGAHLLFFRLEPWEWWEGSRRAIAGFAVGAVISATVVIAGNLIGMNAWAAARPDTLPSASPVWTYLPWTNPSPASSSPPTTAQRPQSPGQASPGTTAAATRPPGEPPAAVPTDPSTPAEKQPATTPVVVGTPSAPVPQVRVRDDRPRDPGDTFGPRSETPPPPAAADAAVPVDPSVYRADSELAKASEVLDVGGDFEAVVSGGPGGEGPVVVVKRGSGDRWVFERRRLGRGDEGLAVAVFPEPVAADVRRSVAVSPDGERFAAITQGNKVGVYSFGKAVVEWMRPLRGVEGTASLTAVTADKRVIVRNTAATLLAWEPDGGNLLTIDLGVLAGPVVATSPDGQRWAAEGVVEGKHVLRLGMLDPSAGETREVALPGVGGDWAGGATGLAFSPDGRRVAVYYERNDAAKLVVVESATGRVLIEPVLTAPTPPRKAGGARFAGSSVAWLPNGRGLLVYGEAILNAETGAKVGSLGLPEVSWARFVGREALEVVVEPISGPRRVVRVTLDVDRLETALGPARRTRPR